MPQPTPLTLPPEDEDYANLSPLDGDPEATMLDVDAADVRETIEQLTLAGAPQYAEVVRDLDRRCAARGRELDRMRALVKAGVKNSMALENEVLARQLRVAAERYESELDEMRKEAREQGEAYAKLQGRCNELAARSRQSYGAWAASEARKVAWG